MRFIAIDHQLSVVDSARLLAQVFVTAADALITAWDSKSGAIAYTLEQFFGTK